MAESLQTDSTNPLPATAAQCTCANHANSITIPLTIWEQLKRTLAQMRGQQRSTDKLIEQVEKQS